MHRSYKLKAVGCQLALSLLTVSCFDSGAKTIQAPEVAVTPPPPSLQRLSKAQYQNSLFDLIGPDLVIPSQIEPDVVAEGLVAIGMSQSTISGYGVEKYEDAAFKIAKQVLANADYRAKVVPCTPAGPSDSACYEQLATAFGGKAWRRPLAAAEVERIAGVAGAAAVEYNDAEVGIEFAIAALLQSPNFLFRVEIGEPDPAGGFRYSGYEMASRLSYFLTNSTPDDAFLAAAADGRLVTDEGIREEAERLLDTAKARQAVRNFFSELHELHELDHLIKDPTIFKHMSKDLGPAAREETLRGIEHIVFEKDDDFRKFFTTQETFVNRRLAALYGVAAPVTDGFSMVTLPTESGRRGFLGQVSFLAQQSHPGTSSAVLRGRFVRVALLCGVVPPPPADFNTGVPEPSETARTLRERSQVHYENPVCANCHQLMDPIGFGLENFDSIGQWRTLDNGGQIDPSGNLDDYTFANAWELAEVVAEHPQLGFCLTRNLYRYATGGVETIGEFAQVNTLSEVFAQSKYRVKELLLQIAISPGFRKVGEVN